jgi:2-C-methyl-D-erythritol 2,4-cyclodiphosphate synthase
VLHAISDALLGAVAAGDLGEHFPDTDPAHQGRSSSWFLARVLTLPELAPWQLVNVDVNVIAQTPRLAGHKLAIREQLARIMAVEISQVSIKARTHEGVDAIGHKEALAAQAVVLLER